MRHLIMKQSDYLTGIGRTAYDEYKFTKEEMEVKDSFRLSLEELARDALGARYPDLQLDQVKLKCYGSLANGFALKDCDMDLLLSLPEYQEAETAQPTMKESPEDEVAERPDDEKEEQGFKADVQRIVEKAFLDYGYGARLLTQTRVPILRICQSPTSTLLQNLRTERAEWEKSIDHIGAGQEALQESEVPTSELDAVEQAVTDLTLTTTTAPAKRGNRGNAGLEFTDDCGIQCDVNFTNFVALHNSTLLRLYQNFDNRVKEIGIFVKIWAKRRDINTPYRGTLSSYGWVLMVLHYLMNVANPPVIPNLQYLAKTEDSWNPDRPIELFEGFDVRFVQDHQGLQDIQQEMLANRNRESAGQLLRGFFQYYGTNQGFHWTRDILSLRTKGGIISKGLKGWTEAKWQQGQNKSVRNRYLLAIEDPFEVEHNIARTVGHHGIVTIRNEFRRAWGIIEKIGTDDEVPAEEFLKAVTDRVDTLKKDLDAFRQKQLQMRQESEAKEKAMLLQQEAEKAENQTDGTWGNSDQGKVETYSSPKSGRTFPDPKLTSPPRTQDRKQLKPSGTWRRRKISVDSDDEEDERSVIETMASPAPVEDGGPRPRNEGLTSRAEVLYANGFDRDGNLVAWDVDTQEGRWLVWRDHKKWTGQIVEFNNPTTRELDEQCPYDSRRPNPYIGKPYRSHRELGAYIANVERPPWPSNKAQILSQPSEPRVLATKMNESIAEDNHAPAQNWSHTASMPDSGEPTQAQSQISHIDGWGAVVEDVCKPASAVVAIPQMSEIVPTGGSNLQIEGDRVGETIPWDKSAWAGRWLRRRDKRIIEGSPSKLWSKTEKRLDAAFPYDPNLTQAALGEKNDILRRHYKRSLHPIESPIESSGYTAAASRDKISEKFSLSHVVRRTVPEPSKSSSQDTVTEEHSYIPQLSPSLINPGFSQGGQSSSALPLSDGHPSQDTVSDDAPSTPPDKERIPDVDFLRMQRLAFFAKYRTPTRSEVDTNAHFYVPAANKMLTEPIEDEVQTPVAPRHHTVLKNGLEETSPQFQPAEGSNSVNQPNRDFSDLAVEVSDSPVVDDSSRRVPATLYPGVADTKRPRDENPNVMPIPRTFGFQFDPRQLQDLAVISKGGNGCAREGAQFNLEEDEYEWGGGGAMGYKTSTGPQAAVVSGGTPYEAGRGDEQGLLDELPRGWEQCTTTSC